MTPHLLSLYAFCSCLTAFFFMLGLCPWMIRKLSRLQSQQPVRDYVPAAHLNKTGTPTLGGVLIIGAIVFSTLLWSPLDNPYLWIVLAALVGFGMIGFVDDYLKVIRKNSHGLAARYKYGCQSILGLSLAVLIYQVADVPSATQFFVPFLGQVCSLGLGFIPWVYLVIVGSSNAVNLTDGLDGLAVMPVAIVTGGLAVLTMCSGIGDSLNDSILHIPGVESLVVFCGAVIGASLGFLWFNTHPAQIFMGDVGALGLGAAMGTLAAILRQEWTLFMMGGIFVWETLSVMLQVLSFKMTGRRLFRMAPFHHHLELKGWSETKVTVRFWMITILLTLAGLVLLIC